MYHAANKMIEIIISARMSEKVIVAKLTEKYFSPKRPIINVDVRDSIHPYDILISDRLIKRHVVKPGPIKRTIQPPRSIMLIVNIALGRPILSYSIPPNNGPNPVNINTMLIMRPSIAEEIPSISLRNNDE